MPKKGLIELYRAKNSRVYKRINENTGEITCEKHLTTSNQSNLERLDREIQILRKVKDFDCCLKIIDSSQKVTRGKYKISITTEFCEGGDLRKELEKREKIKAYYSPREMIDYILEFIDLFSMLQQQSISHRDIKPENILITKGRLKIGDFGSSRFTENAEDFTIAGSPLYLSPQLREGYNKYMKRKGGLNIVHCPYKSDVYSLGLVFASMASLYLITQDFTDLLRLEDLLNWLLGKIPCETLRKIIGVMLIIDSEHRPDFILLKQIIPNILDGTCKVCLQPTKEYQCNTCKFWHHSACMERNCCTYCIPKQMEICTDCRKAPAHKNDLCAHELCEECRVSNMACQYCLGFSVFDDPVEGFVQLPHRYKCTRCHRNIDLSECKSYYHCDNCNIQYCSYCKGFSHGTESCVKSFKNSYIYCKCASLCLKDNESIFLRCDRCTFRCVVCFGKTMNDHLVCAGLYQKIKSLSTNS